MSRWLITLIVAIALSACATARMHTQAELDQAGLACGLQDGELIQDEEAKKMVIFMRPNPLKSQRHCVAAWAQKHHLKLAVIDGVEFKQD